jgi:sec-independent protein translocase protein TatB
MSLSHLIILGVIALIVIPPDKLPELARQLAKFIYELKRSADQIMSEIKQEAFIKPDSILDQKIKDQFADIQKNLSNITNNTQQTNTSPNPPSDINNSTDDKKKNDRQ